MYTGPNIVRDGLILQFDPANIKCFRGEPTVNLIPIEKINVVGGTITKTILSPNHVKFVNNIVDNSHVMYNGANGVSIICSIGDKITFSAEYKTNCKVQMRIRDSWNGSVTLSEADIENTNLEWKKFEVTSDVLVNNPSLWIYTQDYRDWGEYGIVEIRNWQLEVKSHSTPYTSTSRGTTVATGGGLIDLSNNQNHGELVNGVLYDSDNCGSLVFDGVDDSIAVPINNIPIGNSPRTIVIWFKYNKYETIYTAICGYGIQGTANTFDIIIGNNGFNTIALDVYGAGGISTYFDYTNTNWNQVVAIYTGTQLQLYLNGELKSYNNFNINTLSSNLIIGDNVWSYPGMYRGNISQILFYNRALSQSEIQHNYNATKTRYI